LPTKSEKTESQSEAPKAPTTEEPRYDRDRLIREAQPLTGHPSHVVAGALSTSTGTSFTKTQAQELVEKFLNSPVKED